MADVLGTLCGVLLIFLVGPFDPDGTPQYTKRGGDGATGAAAA